jgi:hypothetical protein
MGGSNRCIHIGNTAAAVTFSRSLYDVNLVSFQWNEMGWTNTKKFVLVQPGSFRRHFSPKFCFVQIFYKAPTNDLVTTCFRASSQREGGRPERKPLFVSPWIVNNNPSSLGESIYTD